MTEDVRVFFYAIPIKRTPYLPTLDVVDLYDAVLHHGMQCPVKYPLFRSLRLLLIRKIRYRGKRLSEGIATTTTTTSKTMMVMTIVSGTTAEYPNLNSVIRHIGMHSSLHTAQSPP